MSASEGNDGVGYWFTASTVSSWYAVCAPTKSEAIEAEPEEGDDEAVEEP